MGSARRVVSVNGVVIANGDIAREVQNQEGGSPAESWQAATRALVVRELLRQRAGEMNLTAEPKEIDGVRETEEEALIRGLLDREVRIPEADEATCRHYYESNLARFRGADLFEPQHILFKASQADKAAYALAEQRAEAVLTEVKAAPDRFDAIATALSDCPSASDGGRLGQVARGQTTPEFEAALLKLQPGQIAPDIVRTRYGVHVLRLDRRVDGALLSFAQVHDRIAAYLEENAARRAAAQYVAVLAGRARVCGCDIGGAATPLVQ